MKLHEQLAEMYLSGLILNQKLRQITPDLRQRTYVTFAGIVAALEVPSASADLPLCTCGINEVCDACQGVGPADTEPPGNWPFTDPDFDEPAEDQTVACDEHVVHCENCEAVALRWKEGVFTQIAPPAEDTASVDGPESATPGEGGVQPPTAVVESAPSHPSAEGQSTAPRRCTEPGCPKFVGGEHVRCFAHDGPEASSTRKDEGSSSSEDVLRASSGPSDVGQGTDVGRIRHIADQMRRRGWDVTFGNANGRTAGEMVMFVDDVLEAHRRLSDDGPETAVPALMREALRHIEFLLPNPPWLDERTRDASDFLKMMRRAADSNASDMT